jgi:hypothetical protein
MQSEFRKRIFAHRGLWTAEHEGNSETAFKKAIEYGFSVEVDVRSQNGNIVIQHDNREKISDFSFHDFFKYDLRVAINLKEDGLLPFISALKLELDRTASFVFDGSIPEMFQYKSVSIPHALRLSEFESECPWESDRIWVDCFEKEWFCFESLQLPRFQNKELIFVSPELHGRNPYDFWKLLLKYWESDKVLISLCTDLPLEFEKLL